MLGRIARREVEGTARRPAADSLDRDARWEPPRGVLAVEADGDLDVAAVRDVEAKRPMHVVIGRERKKLLDQILAVERTVHILEEDEKLAGHAAGLVKLRHDHGNRVVRFRCDHGDIGDPVALQENVDRLHVGTLLVGCPTIGIEPLKG
jgi:hypothetical protein